MTKIDWDKPVGHKGQAAEIRFKDDTWAYGVWAGAVGIWLLTTGESVEPLSSHVPDLENIPEEPGREEGWYWGRMSEIGNEVPFRLRDGEWWCGSELRDPAVLGNRIYRDDEFRPADTCPPPMNGTPFEVEGHESTYQILLQTNGDYHVIPDHRDLDRWTLSMLHDKRWRPLQGDQP